MDQIGIIYAVDIRSTNTSLIKTHVGVYSTIEEAIAIAKDKIIDSEYIARDYDTAARFGHSCYIDISVLRDY